MTTLDTLIAQLVRADDGLPVKIGDRLWNVHRHTALVTYAKVQRHWLTAWRASLVGRLFASEQAALALALAEAEQRLKKAKAKLQSERRTVLRLKRRIARRGAV